ncbi:uncharacterized protein [Melanerpes formicivorus]|uniref:uncharacterized protein isoform X1 n=1 Tax=Melanerpes formicivorus TaxID=211600 RepID=UPI00358E9F08
MAGKKSIALSGRWSAAISSETCSGRSDGRHHRVPLRHAWPAADGNRAGTLPPGVKHGSSASARGCHARLPWATATPAKGRQRPAARSCLSKQAQSRLPPAAPGQEAALGGLSRRRGAGARLGTARHRPSARRKWRPHAVRGAGSTRGCSSRHRGSALWRTGTASRPDRQFSSFAPSADHSKASGSGPAAAQGGVDRGDVHLAWKPSPPCPCRGC